MTVDIDRFTDLSNYSRAGDSIQRGEIPGTGVRMPWEREFRPQTYLWSSAMDKWDAAENILSGNLRSLNQKYDAFAQMQRSLAGDSMGVYASWMVGNTMTGLRNRIGSLDRARDRAIGSGQQSYIRAKNWDEGEEGLGWNAPHSVGTRLSEYERFGAMGRGGKEEPGSIDRTPPIPAWLQKFFTAKAVEANKNLAKTMPTKQTRRGEEEDTTETTDKYNWGLPFAPLSTQQDLDPEQVTDMVAALGWIRGGRPVAAGTETMKSLEQGMGEAPPWFDYYLDKSRGLAPKQQNTFTKTARKWRT